MKYKQRKKSNRFAKAVKERLLYASPEFVAGIIRIQRGGGKGHEKTTSRI